jgi:IclR family transcriptional regulator, mhp operon transcriptional activator
MHAKVDPVFAPGGLAPAHSRDSISPVTPVSPVSREQTRPIRALGRGLAMLAELNRLQSAPIHTLAAAVRLPRTTTFRILETLRLAGYVERDPHTDCYRPTLLVRTLSEGFDEVALMAHVAKPHLAELCAQLVWPVELAAPAGAAIVVRETTQSPLALEAHRAGMRMGMLGSAAGRAYLAHAAPARREALLDLLSHSTLPEDRLARDRAEVERLLGQVRAQGYGVTQRARRVSEETSLAIPLHAQNEAIAALGVRFAATAVPLRSAIDQFLPKMLRIACIIESEFDKTHSDRR